MQQSNFKYYLDIPNECLFVRCYGVITKPSLFECVTTCRAAPDYHNDFSVLTDYSNCDFQATSSDLRELAAFMKNEWPTTKQIKAAIIVDNKLAHGLMRMYEAYSDSRAKDAKLFAFDHPNLSSEIRQYFNLPPDYNFPDFLDL